RPGPRNTEISAMFASPPVGTMVGFSEPVVVAGKAQTPIQECPMRRMILLSMAVATIACLGGCAF
ncbi:MAG: hypothetical protein ACO3EP_12525, partial [Phycisphaerales bacterium]